jgi:hypothetical protein
MIAQRGLRGAAALAGAAAVAAALTADPAAAAARACQAPDERPRTSLRIDQGRVAVDTSLDIDALGRRMNSGFAAFRGWHTVGLTTAELTFALKLAVMAAPLAGGGYCGWATGIDADLGFETITVHIARRYRPGSCQFKTVKRHEDRHVAVFRRALDDHAPRFRAALRAAAAELGAVASADADRAADRLKRMLTARIRPVFRAIDADIKRENARIDTRQSYERDMARCPTW